MVFSLAQLITSWLSVLITNEELSSSGKGEISSYEESVISFLLLNCTLHLVARVSLIDQMILCHLDVHLIC